MSLAKTPRWLPISLAVLVVFNLGLLIILGDDLLPMLSRSEGSLPTPTNIEPSPVPSITPSLMPSATPTQPPPIAYSVKAGDTLWGIAQMHGTTVAAILQANPSIDPGGLISEGEVILIPVGDTPAADVPDSQWEFTAQVTFDSGGLRLRKQPSLESDVITTLAALMPLTVIGRTSDSTWMEVRTPFLEYGWVSAEFLELSIETADIPVIWRPDIPPQGEDPASGTEAPISSPDSYPYVSGLADHLIEVFELGQSLGNGENVFSKIGDSITVNSGFLNSFGTRHYMLQEHAYLQPAIEHFESGWARTHTPFANRSLAAEVGWSSVHVVQAGMGDAEYCGDEETPLECEYRYVRPSIAVIMLGTNDLPSMPSEMYEASMREIIEVSLERGIIPLISTIPRLRRAGMESRVAIFNGILSNLAGEYQIPLVDYWSALQALPNQGIGSDGVHPTMAPGRDDGNLSADNLSYGIPMRNLVTLQALDAIWRYISQEE